MKIKPLRKKHRFLRWLKKLLGIQSPSGMRELGDIDEMHMLKGNIQVPPVKEIKDTTRYYVPAEIIGELPSGRVKVNIFASGDKVYNVFMERSSLIREGDLFVEIPVDKPCPKCGHVDRYLGSVCEPQSVSMEIVREEERDNGLPV